MKTANALGLDVLCYSSGALTKIIERRANLLQRMSLVMAHRVISRRRSNSVAFGAKRTFSEPLLLNRVYEYAP
jgi:hypothetical protein